MIEEKTDMDKIEGFCIERLNHKNPKVCAGGCEVEYGEFLRRNNPVKFKEELDSFIAKLRELKILGLTPASDPKNQYYFTAIMDAHLSILKYVD